MTGDTYVHDPDAVDGESADADPDEVEPDDGDEFGRSGWLLVGVMLLAFVVAPLLIYLRPPGLPFKFAYLVLPLVPALLLGATAVWAAQSSK
ncbi:hypothetical protein [Halomicrococcus gelatinilyticus]|uniref:hypothetical protein n=1 Tax=Halomicrococcus gelatinilyticus TaxID=1702103 RepID=UPI002E12FDF9